MDNITVLFNCNGYFLVFLSNYCIHCPSDHAWVDMYHFYTANVVVVVGFFLCVCGGGGTQHAFRLPKLSSLDFRSVRLANWKLIASEKGVLWTRPVKFEGMRAEILANFDALEAQIPHFFKGGGLWLTFKLCCLKWDSCKTGEVWKGVFRAASPHTPFLG